MENKIKIYDLIITCILIAVVLIGVVNVVSIKANEETGRLTLDNYKEYLTVNLAGSITAGTENDCAVRFSAVNKYKLTDVEVTFSIAGRNNEQQQYSVSFSDVTSAKPYLYDVRVFIDEPSLENMYEVLGAKITVISISGTYKGRK